MPLSTPRLLALGAGFLLAAAPQAQTTALVIDDFEDGELTEYDQFQGGEASTLSVSGTASQGTSALSFATDADDYGGFTGFFRAVPGAPYDASGLDDPYLVFDLAATNGLTLEINFQDGDGTGGEVRNALVLPGDGEYQRYALSLATFLNTREVAFNDATLGNLVLTVINATGDGNSDTQETVLLVDNVRLVEGGIGVNEGVVAEDFNGGDYSANAGYFYFAGGEFIAAAPSTDTPDGSANAFQGMIDADGYGGYAGFGRAFPGSPIDVSGYETMSFFLKTSGAGRLEVNLQSDQVADAAEEGRDIVSFSDTGGEYVQYTIPLAALIQSQAQPVDLSAVTNYVFTVVGLTGDGNPDSAEFTFAVDRITFGGLTPPTAGETAPDVFALAPTTFPNPTAGAATVAFELATASTVSVDVFDLLGRRVAQVASRVQAAGPVALSVPTAELSSGVYVIRVVTAGGAATTRLTVVR